jgi:three-Cys-motif partner protein
MGNKVKTPQLPFGGGWTDAKLNILRKYMSAFNTALKKQLFTRIYVDAFAGTGYRLQRQDEFQVPDLFDESSDQDSQELLKGSARIALEVQPPFHRFIFVETDRAKVKELEALKAASLVPASQIVIEQKDANVFLQDFCVKQRWSGHRAVVFLDPFATQVSWQTVEAIAKTQAIDVWILFPLMAVNRLLAKDASKAFRNRLDTIFGTSEWFQRFYSTERAEDIFGQPLNVIRKMCNPTSIGAFYEERLRTVFAGVASEKCVWDNSRDAPLFQFFFAAANPVGARVAVPMAEDIIRRER